jgi:serine/threonine protein kinase
VSTRFGKYILLHQLAVGGMAEIYLAKQTGLEGFEKLVVLKKILSTMTEQREFVEMFVNEARIAARLNHPQIVQIYDLGRVKNSYFIAMEYVHGEDLRAISKASSKRGAPLPFWHVARVIGELLQGLHFAHTRTDGRGQPMCIVHRDVSPQNILVSYEGTVKIVDFGIAKATLTPLTMAGVIKGKYAYMSPEQCRGEPLDGRADLFSAGIILYELCTGQRLFKRATDFATLMAVKEAAIAPPRSLRSDIAPELDRIILKALERDLSKRYATAQEMQLDLEEFLRKGQYQTGNVALSTLMRELFTDKLAAQAEAIKHSQVDSFEALLLEDHELEPSIITGVGRDEDDEPSGGLIAGYDNSAAVTAAAVPGPRAKSVASELLSGLPGGPGVLAAAEVSSSSSLAHDDGPDGAPTAANVGGHLGDSAGTGPAGLESDQPSFLGPQTVPKLRAGIGGDRSDPHHMPSADELPQTRELAPLDVPLPIEDQETLQLDPDRLALSGRVGIPLGLPPKQMVLLDLPPSPSQPPPEPGPPTVTRAVAAPGLGSIPGSLQPRRSFLNPRLALLAGGALVLLAALGALLGRMLFGREQLTSFVVKTVPAGASIELDGLTMQARTPAQLSSVTAGRDHKLRLSLAGFDPYESVVKVPRPEAGAELLTVMSNLVPVRAAALITTAPAGATVELDGQPRGATPVLLVDLPPGTHKLVVRKDDTVGRQDLVLVAKQLTTVDVPLHRAETNGTLSLTSSQPATVSTPEGKVLGTTPLEAVAVPAGEQTLVLRWRTRRAPRPREKRVTVTITAGQLTQQRVELGKD